MKLDLTSKEVIAIRETDKDASQAKQKEYSTYTRVFWILCYGMVLFLIRSCAVLQ